MRRLIAAMLAIMLLALGCAAAEEAQVYPETPYLPEDARAEVMTNAMRQYAVEATGETWTVLQSGNVCHGVVEAPWDGSVSMEEFIAQKWPEAWILKATEGEELFLDMTMAGRCTAAEDKLVIELSFGEFRDEERMLAAGAIAVMGLYRPQATVTGVELDDDDGLIIYEGEAYVDGVEYEFEVDVYTGRLLEWDRD